MTLNEIENLRVFFEELKSIYFQKNQDFVWNWEQIEQKQQTKNQLSLTKDFVHYIAYNLGKNVLHGPLPNHLHTRMILETSNWSKKYVAYLEGK